VIAAVAAVSFIPLLGRLHLFDWDEINFAEGAREMLVTGNYRDVQIGFQSFAEKPPLFMWVQAMSMRIFGVGEFAARLPNAIVGIITLVCLYFLGRRLVDRRFGLWWALAFGGSLLPNLYFRSGIIDPLFNLLIFAAVVTLFEFEQKRRWSLLLVAGLSVGLAVLTKGPVGILLPGLTWVAFWIVKQKRASRVAPPASRFPLPIVPMLVWVGIAGIVAAPWYMLVAREGAGAGAGNFVSAFVARQLELLRTGVAGHTGPWYFHLVVLALGCFPASVFAISALGRRTVDSATLRDFRLWMILLLIVVIVIFSVVQTKIVHYSSLAYFPITFLAALAITDVERNAARWPRYLGFAAGGIGLIWAAVLLALPVLGLMIAHGQLDPSRVVRDPFVRATVAVPVGWSAVDLVPGGAYLVAILCAVFILVRRREDNSGRFAAILFGATAAIVPLALARIAPKVERYTQATPIEFYESLRGCDCYITTLGFKSYAHLFYGRISPQRSAAAPGLAPDRYEGWLLSGPIDRPVYFVSKLDRADRWRNQPGIKIVGERNGFVFLRRDPPT
jgi:4-amino-4-deoxy-L-arabinose transferase-like glycosyltransferase